ncbi:hypothetical protein MRX96_005022 [Rhipicephalus microplus]
MFTRSRWRRQRPYTSYSPSSSPLAASFDIEAVYARGASSIHGALVCLSKSLVPTGGSHQHRIVTNTAPVTVFRTYRATLRWM